MCPSPSLPLARTILPTAGPGGRGKRWFSLAIYPVTFGAGAAAIAAGVGSGVAYWKVGPPVMALCALAVMALERWWPHATAWQRAQGDRATDTLHLAGNVLVSQSAATLYALAHAVTGGALGLWPAGLPFAAQLLLGVLILDLGLYAVHRASHAVPWLWRLHAVHHSARRLYWQNSQRRHLAHELLEGAPGLLALGALGAPGEVVACGLAVITIHLMFQHGNIDYRAGALKRVFAVAELHRWHHQRLYRDVQGNYGAVFSIWDQLLGTALPQRGDAPLDVGMDDEPDLPQDYLGQLRWPFQARREPRI